MKRVGVDEKIYAAAEKAGFDYGATVEDGDVIELDTIKMGFDEWVEGVLDVNGADPDEVARLLAQYQSGFISGIPKPWLKGDALWMFVSRALDVACVGAGVESRKTDTYAPSTLDGFAGAGVSGFKLRQMFNEFAAQGLDLVVERERLLLAFMAGYQKEHLKMARESGAEKEV